MHVDSNSPICRIVPLPSPLESVNLLAFLSGLFLFRTVNLAMWVTVLNSFLF